MESDPDDRWYFSKERLDESPSRKHGIDADKELSCRQQAANFIQDMGQKLCVSQLCINTAIVYMHRFYVFHSLAQFHRTAIATAALFLAAKVEEQPRKVEHILKIAHLCLHREAPAMDTKSEMYLEQATDLVVNESILLQTLGFDVAIDHPHTHVVRCCQLVKASKDLAQTSYFMASNSLHLTTMCLQYKPTVVACFCIHLACKWSNWEIPRSSEGKDWFWYVNQSVTLDLLEQLTSEFLLIFDKCPTKLKRKMMSLNQSNPPVNFGQLGGSQENCHFDEPRKLLGAEANRPPDSFLQMQKNADKNSSSGANTSAGSSSAQQQHHAQHPPQRHMDIKEYKEKKERERQDRERDVINNAGAPVAQPHGPPKQPDKNKPHSSQRPSSSGMSHKGYPQQRSHPGNPSGVSTKDIHQQRSAIKEATKRKFEEVDGTAQTTDMTFQDSSHSKSYPRNPDEYRHKSSGHVVSTNPNFTGQPTEAHAQTKDYTVSGIRDIITQPFSAKDKSQRLPEGERHFPNYPYPRSDKYSTSGRSGQPTVIAKPQREDMTKRPEDYQRHSDESNVNNPDWHGKQSTGLVVPQSHVTDRHSSMPQQQQQIKQRDPKYKTHQQTPQKEPSQKQPLPLVQGSMHGSLPSHKKSAEKDKRKYAEQQIPVIERGLPSSMESLLSPEDARQLPIDPKRHHQDIHKKEKSSSSSKFSSKPKSSAFISPIKDAPPQQQHQPSLYSHPTNDMELPSLVDKVERPAKIPRLDDRKKLVEHEQHKQYVPVISEPVKTSSIFSPESNLSPKNILTTYEKDSRKSDLHFSSAPKKQTSSLFSPPSMPHLLSHRSGSSSSSEREVSGPITSVPISVIRQERDLRNDQDNVLPLLDEKVPEQKHHRDKHYVDNSVTTNTANSAIPPSAPAAHVSRHMSSNRHSSVNEAGAIIYPPAEKSKVAGYHTAAKQPAPPENKPASPVSTVNLLGMDKLVDTSISPTVAAVIKPLPVARSESTKAAPLPSTTATPAAVLLSPPITAGSVPATPHSPVVKEEPPKTGDGESHRKHEKKKKDKDRDREGHRHKEKKKSDGKKEKKKHKDKDRERKKDSHRDKEKHREKVKEVPEVMPAAVIEKPLKITIPKDKLPEGSLKIKIAKDRLKPEDIEVAKVSAPEGSLKIKIKKDVITNYKEEKGSSKKKESSSHGSHHKSSKSSKSESSSKSKKDGSSKSSSSKASHGN